MASSFDDFMYFGCSATTWQLLHHGYMRKTFEVLIKMQMLDIFSCTFKCTCHGSPVVKDSETVSLMAGNASNW